jgi:hypothetical protein
MKLASVLVFVFSITQAGFAQDDTSTSKPEIDPDLRVQVKLNNGAFITGIAKEGRLIERLKRGGFRTLADKKDPHSGIRVWNYRRTIGYIFLKYRTVEVVKVLGVLTQEEKRLLEESLARAAEVRRSKSRTGADGGSVKLEGLTKSEHGLLKKFDPGKGWSPERFGEIQRRRIVLNQKPSRKEEEFCDVYTEWESAFKKWSLARQAATREESKNSGTTKDTRSTGN